MIEDRPKLLFLVTEDWYFHMHRLPQARAALAAGFEVCVATRVQGHGERIVAEGFRPIPLRWRRGSLNPLRALADTIEIARLYRRERPDIVHHVSLKSIVLGTLAARFFMVPKISSFWTGGIALRSGIPPSASKVSLVTHNDRRLRGGSWIKSRMTKKDDRQVKAFPILNAYTGLGQLFLGDTPQIKALRFVLLPLLRFAFRSPRVYSIAENSDHLQTLIDERVVDPARATVIRGSGIDIDRFPLLPEPPRVPPVIACAARMLRSKGILVLAEAMRILALRSPIKLLLAGVPDPESRDSLTEAEMQRIAAEPNIEWLGRIDDVRGLWQRAHIGVLPSLTGEGLPVGLMEAASCGRALVATDVAGCREIVIPGVNGLLVPPGDAEALAEALETLAHGYDLRLEYGLASRRMVESELSASEVGARTVALYRKLMESM